MLNRDQLHALIDALPDDHLLRIGGAIEKLTPPVYLSLLTAPEDDEPETDEERSAVEEAKAAVARGEVFTHEEIRIRYGL